MSENAAGQLLGYSIQYPRALCHLLRATPGSTVCIEVHGDVASLLPDGLLIVEEDKSSIRNNPVTDRSVDLWKTLSNWLDSVLVGELDPDRTTFILYRNQTGRSGLAELFSAASSPQMALEALKKAKTDLSDIDEAHAAWKYFKKVVIDNLGTSVKIIQNFCLETGSGAGFEEVEREVKAKHVPGSQIKFLVVQLGGWLLRTVTERIATRQDARITWDEFDSYVCSLFDRARRRELIDFTLEFPPLKDDVQKHLAIRPNYLRQIELIQGTDDDLLEAVTDYLKAQTNRFKWIEEELIDEQVAQEFEGKLQRFWGNAQKRIALVHNNLSPEDRGQLLLVECKTRNETIRGEAPPPSTIEGTYHALADKPTLGWHTDWEDKTKNVGR